MIELGGMKCLSGIFVSERTTPKASILLPDTKGRCFVIFKQEGFGWNHPLRKAWRKTSQGGDWSRIPLGAFLVAGIVQLGLFTIQGSGASMRWLHVSFTSLLFFWVPMWLIALELFAQTSFKKPLARASEVLGIPIKPDMPMNRLRELAQTKLCSLAQAWREAEGVIGSDPHAQRSYDEREQAKSAFVETHKFLLGLELVEKKWDRYFKEA